jgi:hypothetical protein
VRAGRRGCGTGARAARGEVELLLHQTVATEVVYVLRNLYGMDPQTVATVPRELLAMRGIADVDALPWAALLDAWPEEVPALADAVLVVVRRAERCDAVATFDTGRRRRLLRLGLGSHLKRGSSTSRILPAQRARHAVAAVCVSR